MNKRSKDCIGFLALKKRKKIVRARLNTHLLPPVCREQPTPHLRAPGPPGQQGIHLHPQRSRAPLISAPLMNSTGRSREVNDFVSSRSLDSDTFRRHNNAALTPRTYPRGGVVTSRNANTRKGVSGVCVSTQRYRRLRQGRPRLSATPPLIRARIASQSRGDYFVPDVHTTIRGGDEGRGGGGSAGERWLRRAGLKLKADRCVPREFRRRSPAYS